MKILGGIFLMVVLIFSAYFGKNVPFSSQWPLYEALRTTASIIFAVVGAWFAIIYPERLKNHLEVAVQRVNLMAVGLQGYLHQLYILLLF